MLKIILSIGSIQVIAIAIQFLRSKVVAVMLGPAGVGIVSTIDQIVQFAAFVTALSIPFASIKFLSKAHSEGHEEFRRSYANFFRLLAVLSLIGLFISAGLVYFRPQLFGAEIEKYQLFLLIALFSLPTLIFGGFFTNVFAAAQQYRTSAILTVINNAIITTAIIIGIAAAGILGLFIGGSLAGIIITIGISIYLWKKMNLPLLVKGTTDGFRNFWVNSNVASFTLMLYLSSVSYSLSLLVARYAILTSHGEAETGLLQGALVLSIAVGMVLSPANGLYLTPIMNRNTDKSEKIRYAIAFQRKIVFILSLITIIVVMFPQLLLAILFSNKFVSVGHLVFLFVFAQFILQLAGVYQAFLIGTDDLKVYALITTGGQLGYAALAWFLAPVYGIKGIALASIFSSVLIFSFTYFRLRFKHGFLVPLNLLILIVYSLSLLLIIGWTCSYIEEWNIINTIFKVSFFVFFAMSLFLFLNKEEKYSLNVLWNKYISKRIR